MRAGNKTDRESQSDQKWADQKWEAKQSGFRETRANVPSHHSRLLAKARPDPVLRYFSNAKAFVGSENARKPMSFQGLNPDV